MKLFFEIAIFLLFASAGVGYILALVSNVTSILDQLQRGESKAAEELLPLVYDELRKLAAHRMASEKPGHTLQPTQSARGLAQSKTLTRVPQVHGPNARPKRLHPFLAQISHTGL